MATAERGRVARLPVYIEKRSIVLAAQRYEESRLKVEAAREVLVTALDALRASFAEMQEEINSEIGGVTKRQSEVLGLIKLMSNKEIASKLNISERTVKFHVSALFRKFGCSSRHEL